MSVLGLIARLFRRSPDSRGRRVPLAGGFRAQGSDRDSCGPAYGAARGGSRGTEPRPPLHVAKLVRSRGVSHQPRVTIGCSGRLPPTTRCGRSWCAAWSSSKPNSGRGRSVTSTLQLEPFHGVVVSDGHTTTASSHQLRAVQQLLDPISVSWWRARSLDRLHTVEVQRQVTGATGSPNIATMASSEPFTSHGVAFFRGLHHFEQSDGFPGAVALAGVHSLDHAGFLRLNHRQTRGLVRGHLRFAPQCLRRGLGVLVRPRLAYRRLNLSGGDRPPRATGCVTCRPPTPAVPLRQPPFGRLPRRVRTTPTPSPPGRPLVPERRPSRLPRAPGSPAGRTRESDLGGAGRRG